MTKELRAALDAIDTVLVSGDENANALWTVLSALRGPDNGNEETKLESTAPIRATAFPRTAFVIQQGEKWVGAYMGEPNTPAPTSIILSSDYSHFNDHTSRAARVLDLTILPK